MKKRVIKRDNLPSKIPVFQMMTAYLMLDKFNATDWVWGVVGTIMAVVFIGNVVNFFKETEVDVL